LLVAAVAILASAQAALPGQTECVGPLTGDHDNVTVPEAAVCILEGVRIRGNLVVRADAELHDSIPGINTVGGNLRSDGAASVVLMNTQVAGRADFKNTVVAAVAATFFAGRLFQFQVEGDLTVNGAQFVFFEFGLVGGSIDVRRVDGADIVVRGMHIAGNVRIRDSVVTLIEVDQNEIAGSVEVSKNVIDSILFFSNAITGDVDVTENVLDSPFQSLIQNNRVAGNLTAEDNLLLATLQFGIVENSVGADLSVIRNRGPEPKTVANNIIAATLRCFDNDPPFVGGPNTAGRAEGQCF
jgi:hypothetical protein